MQTVFKVDLPSWIRQDEEKAFISRRSHKKSRAGCIACKKRRIKCDEAAPRCGHCLKTNAVCNYRLVKIMTRETFFEAEREPPCFNDDWPTAVEDLASTGSTSNEAQPSPRPDMYSMSVDLLSTDLDMLLNHNGNGGDILPTTGNVRILQHFQGITALTLGGSRHMSVFQNCVARKAFELPYLMHMTMAVSCAHLKRLALDSSRLTLHRKYAIAEAAHWQTGLQLYSHALTESEHDPDGTVTATFLTIIFTFALDDELPQDSYACNDDNKLSHAINPLAATGGFGALRGLLGERMLESVWKAVLLDSDDDSGTFTSEQCGIAGLPTAFVELCELDKNSTTKNNPYHAIVRLLTPILRLKSGGDNFTKLIAFSGRTWPHFRLLLLRKDARALLLISYWFAVMRQIDQWWIRVRAKTECLAIVNYLCQLGDPMITALLPFPASFGQADLSYLW